MTSTNFSHYNESSSYYNGQKINDKKNYMKYDGNKLLFLKNDNGNIEYQTLSNKDINNMILQKQSQDNLEDRLGKILILRNKKTNKDKNVTKKKKKCKKGSRRNRVTGRCRKIVSSKKNEKKTNKNLTKTKSIINKQLRNYTPDKFKTIW